MCPKWLRWQATLAHCSLPTVGDAVEEKADFSIAGEKVFVTSVPGIAMHDLETVDSQRGDATAVQDLESGGTPAAPSTNDPSLWTPGQVFDPSPLPTFSGM